ncbi:hypothetical protein AWB69_01188 [Caballeronia udeis]|uniref:Uncharacterized protein n=1 Tax=Caballeronia udeis TaxID=1232866 RepID=A0A158FJV0_9BURK|nr:hypothetical protein AWB69_01188 [Caballeronia udeis]
MRRRVPWLAVVPPLAAAETPGIRVQGFARASMAADAGNWPSLEESQSCMSVCLKKSRTMNIGSG